MCDERICSLVGQKRETERERETKSAILGRFSLALSLTHESTAADELSRKNGSGDCVEGEKEFAERGKSGDRSGDSRCNA